MVVDEDMYFKFSNFYEIKNAMIEPTYVLLNKLYSQSIVTKQMRLDNIDE